ncbi:glycosyltransferase family 2 protein [Isoptericola rhizosphaerae]|uniref:glycosyltransferase family 2 protein n=1 Tax=Isoptericola rhizosphaerae TaxID=3377837 RepID=UPI003839D325
MDAAADRPIEDPRVTVVVASRNRREELVAGLGRHRAPVILLDNGSTDGTPEAVRRAHPGVEVVELGRNAGAAARTEGVRRARTPYVAFADDDSWWAAGSLHAAAEVLATAPQVGLVAVETLVGADERRDAFTDVLAASPLPSRAPAPVGPRVLGFMACAAMVRRSAFLDAGGFDDVVRFPGEEERLAWDLTAHGHDLVHLPGAAVHHHPSPLRHAPEARRRAVARSRALTSVMRLPWPDVADRTLADVRSGAPERRGVRDAVADLSGALRAREVLPSRVVDDIRSLRRAAAG